MKLNKRTLKFDPEKCFTCWLESGSTRVAVQMYKEKYGIEPHFNTLRRYAFRYILENQEQCRDILKNNGNYWAYDDDLWDNFLIKKAKFVFSPNGERKNLYGWLVHNSLLKRAIDFGHLPPDFGLDDVR